MQNKCANCPNPATHWCDLYGNISGPAINTLTGESLRFYWWCNDCITTNKKSGAWKDNVLKHMHPIEGIGDVKSSIASGPSWFDLIEE